MEYGANLDEAVEVLPRDSMEPHPQLRLLMHFAWEAVDDPGSVTLTLNAIHYAAWGGAVEVRYPAINA